MRIVWIAAILFACFTATPSLNLCAQDYSALLRGFVEHHKNYYSIKLPFDLPPDAGSLIFHAASTTPDFNSVVAD